MQNMNSTKNKILQKQNLSSTSKTHYFDLDAGKLIESTGIHAASRKSSNVAKSSLKRKFVPQTLHKAEIPLKISKFPSPINSSMDHTTNKTDHTPLVQANNKVIESEDVQKASRGRSINRINPLVKNYHDNLFVQKEVMIRKSRNVFQRSYSRDRSVSNSRKKSSASFKSSSFKSVDGSKKSLISSNTNFKKAPSRERSASRNRNMQNLKKTASKKSLATIIKNLPNRNVKSVSPVIKQESPATSNHTLQQSPSKSVMKRREKTPDIVLKPKNKEKVEYKFKNMDAFEDKTQFIISKACMLQLLDDETLESANLNSSKPLSKTSLLKLTEMIKVNRSKAVEDAKKIITELKCDILQQKSESAGPSFAEKASETSPFYDYKGQEKENKEVLVNVMSFDSEYMKDASTNSSLTTLTDTSQKNIDNKLEETSNVLNKIENILKFMKGNIKEKTEKYPWQKMKDYKKILTDIEDTLLQESFDNLQSNQLDEKDSEDKIFSQALKQMSTELTRCNNGKMISEEDIANKLIEIFQRSSSKHCASSDEEIVSSKSIPDNNKNIKKLVKKKKNKNKKKSKIRKVTSLEISGTEHICFKEIYHSEVIHVIRGQKSENLIIESAQKQRISTTSRAEVNKSKSLFALKDSSRKDFVLDDSKKVVTTQRVLSIQDQNYIVKDCEDTPPILIDLSQGKDVILELRRILEENKRKRAQEELEKPFYKRKKYLKRDNNNDEESFTLQVNTKPIIDIVDLRNEVMNNSVYSVFKKQELGQIPEGSEGPKVESYGVSLLVRDYVDEKFKEMFLQRAEKLLNKLHNRNRNVSKGSVTKRIVSSILEKKLSGISNMYKM